MHGAAPVLPGCHGLSCIPHAHQGSAAGCPTTPPFGSSSKLLQSPAARHKGPSRGRMPPCIARLIPAARHPQQQQQHSMAQPAAAAALHPCTHAARPQVTRGSHGPAVPSRRCNGSSSAQEEDCRHGPLGAAPGACWLCWQHHTTAAHSMATARQLWVVLAAVYHACGALRCRQHGWVQGSVAESGAHTWRRRL